MIARLSTTMTIAGTVRTRKVKAMRITNVLNQPVFV